jgi:hypothetical protein
MSGSPPKNEQEAEQGAQSGEEPDQMDREQEGVQQGLVDFEVKEQDRWLPIANGWFCLNLRFRFGLYLICASPCVNLLRLWQFADQTVSQSRELFVQFLSFVAPLPSQS